MRVHSSVEEKVEKEGFAFLPVAVEFFWWVASQFSCECGGACRYSPPTTSSPAPSTSPSAAAATSTSSASASAATAKGNGLDGEAGNCGRCCGGLGLGACHDVRREGLWGGCCLLGRMWEVFGIAE